MLIWEALAPSYNPDIAPCDYYLVLSIFISFLAKTRFNSEEEVTQMLVFSSVSRTLQFLSWYKFDGSNLEIINYNGFILPNKSYFNESCYLKIKN